MLFEEQYLGHKGRGRALVAWQKEFENMLKQGPHAALHGAKKCKIKMTKTQDVLAVAAGATNMGDVEDTTTHALRGFATTTSTVE
jgi:hypothetical protein